MKTATEWQALSDNAKIQVDALDKQMQELFDAARAERHQILPGPARRLWSALQLPLETRKQRLHSISEDAKNHANLLRSGEPLSADYLAKFEVFFAEFTQTVSSAGRSPGEEDPVIAPIPAPTPEPTVSTNTGAPDATAPTSNQETAQPSTVDGGTTTQPTVETAVTAPDEAPTTATSGPATGLAQPDLGLPSTGSIFDKAGGQGGARSEIAAKLQNANKKKDPTVNINADRNGIVSHDADWRVRITLAESAKVFYRHPGAESTLMAPLIKSGVIFPYTPQISVTHVANYSDQSLTHANYQSYFYQNSAVQDVSITADFTAQNHDEARYVLAVIYFFRAATKMFYGSDKAKSGLVGSPPPIVFLNGYGKHYFPNIPCVVSSFQHTMPDNVDYIPVKSPIASSAKALGPTDPRSEETRIPTFSQMSIVLKPMYSRKNIYDNFSLDDFAQGKLLGNKVRGSGGFL